MLKRRAVASSVILLMFLCCLLSGLQKAREALAESEIVDLLNSGVPPARVEALAREYGITFSLTPEAARRLAQIGATESLLTALEELSSKAPQSTVLALQVTPGGAQVYLDDVLVGKTSSKGILNIPEAPAGEHRVRFTLEGYHDHEQVVQLASGGTLQLVVALEAAKVAGPPVKQPASGGVKGDAARRVQEPEMILIPEGEFLMGAERGPKAEKPVHRVHVSEFYIGRYPVTNDEYKQFVDANGYRPPVHWQGVKSDYTLWAGASFRAEIARQPVINVSWDDAVAYCEWLRRATGKPYRLPTEAEWEKAARGGAEQKLYPWGDEPPDHSKAWFGRQWIGTQTLRDVDFGIPNGYGLYGIAGNVMQWVADWYEEKYYKKSPPRDPQGPAKGVQRVARGGCWQLSAGRTSERHGHDPNMRSAIVGFRVAR